MNKYLAGSTVAVRVKNRSRDNNGNPAALADASAAVWTVTDPDGNSTNTTSPNSPSSKIATGIYQIIVTTDQVGIWTVKINLDGAWKAIQFEAVKPVG